MPVPITEADFQQVGEVWQRLRGELGRVIVGQHQVLEHLCIALIAGGHSLLVGVPGLAKTLMVRSLAEALGLSFNRIQFTPDLMPADIIGTEVIQEDRTSGARELRFLKGPVFAHIVLADEINRTPPKTQAALLEAMQEHQVTVGGVRHQLPEPFFVLATQNPIEQEGTYPLPEAQRDRFMLEVHIEYPGEEEELAIVRGISDRQGMQTNCVVSHEELANMQRVAAHLPMADHVMQYATSLARATRQGMESSPDFIKKYVEWGAGPRASQALVMSSRARAALQGRLCANFDDVKAMAPSVLRHRIITNFAAEADGVSTDDIVTKLLDHIPTDPEAASLLRKLPAVFKRQA